ncbi:MAG: hypothetical protein GYA59_15350, partial [Chloroflexi bacterium]|nr:hypothetical protein [Chloroflexota bacterium]
MEWVSSLLNLLRQAWEYAAARPDEFTHAVGDHLLLVAIALGVGVLVC